MPRQDPVTGNVVPHVDGNGVGESELGGQAHDLTATVREDPGPLGPDVSERPLLAGSGWLP